MRNRNMSTCAHFCCKMVYCGIWNWCIVGFVREVIWLTQGILFTREILTKTMQHIIFIVAMLFASVPLRYRFGVAKRFLSHIAMDKLHVIFAWKIISTAYSVKVFFASLWFYQEFTLDLRYLFLQGLYSLRRCRLTDIGMPIINLRPSQVYNG